MILVDILCRETISTMWFIGLVFKKTESLNIDLTQDIQAFTGQGISYICAITAESVFLNAVLHE